MLKTVGLYPTLVPAGSERGEECPASRDKLKTGGGIRFLNSLGLRMKMIIHQLIICQAMCCFGEVSVRSEQGVVVSREFLYGFLQPTVSE